jgi:hypothetical protein
METEFKGLTIQEAVARLIATLQKMGKYEIK